jgi:3-isopropylmalate dehydrogenase
MRLNITILPGDGIGPEVTTEAVKVLRAISQIFGHDLQLSQHLIGGCALDERGSPLPDDTLEACISTDAVLLGAVGGPKYESNERGMKPEDGLLRLRHAMGVFANLRPVTVYDELVAASPLKADKVRGSDMLIVRELLGGLYFGQPRGFERGDTIRAYNTMSYTTTEIERIAHIAFRAAQGRRRRVTSVDKANVLEVSQLWREVVTSVAQAYPEVELEHALVDSCAMRLITDPSHFDVVLTENMFGDILSDEAAVIASSIGLLASASLGEGKSLYEPIHGSAPDIAGTGKANPIGAINSAAMMLRHSFSLEEEATAVENAVRHLISTGARTADLAVGGKWISTTDFGDKVCQVICNKK